MDHKTEIALAFIIGFARQIWGWVKASFLYVYKKVCTTKKLQMRISKQVIEMTAEPICIVLQMLQTRSEFQEYVEQELVLFDQQVSRQLLPMVSCLSGVALSLKKKIRSSLGKDVGKQVDACVTAIDEVTDWHYPTMTYTSLRTKCLKALVEWQSMMRSILVDDAIKEWAVERMAEYCFQRGISDKTPLCGYDNPGGMFNSQKLA